MTTQKKLIQKIREIQKDLSVPKDRKNTYGGFNYRSCEDILEALKPMLSVKGLTMKITDEVVNIGDRYYIKAIVKITDGENSEMVTAYARESEERKGMDVAQVSGASSSYARKYALNGMFLIDDTRDPDTMDNRQVGLTVEKVLEKIKETREDPTQENKEELQAFLDEIKPKTTQKQWNLIQAKLNPKES